MRLDTFINKFQLCKKTIDRIGLKKFLKCMVYSSHKEIILIKILPERESYPSDPLLKVIPVEKQHLAGLKAFRQMNQCGGEEVETYLKNGFTGSLALFDGEIMGYSWWGDCNTTFDFNPQGFEFYVKEVTFLPTDTYGCDLFIDPRFRNPRVILEYMSCSLNGPMARGSKRIFLYVREDNAPARLIYRRSGFTEVKKVTVRRFFLFFLFKNKKFFWDPYGFEWLLKIPVSSFSKRRRVVAGKSKSENKNQ
jgi:ribosomal protein S18 acetylase RimI-like enzyme